LKIDFLKPIKMIKKISGKSLCLKYFVKNGIFAFFYLWAPRPVGATKMLGDERADWGMVRLG
jgi:hypothetical protein